MFIYTSKGLEPVDFNEINFKITKLSKGLSYYIDPSIVAQKTIQRLADHMTTKQIDELSASIAGSLANIHPDYSILGARILMDRLHRELNLPLVDFENLKDQKNLEKINLNLNSPFTTFAENINKLFHYKINGRKSTRISQAVYDFIQKYAKELEDIIDYQSDFKGYTYASLISWFKRGLEQIDGQVAEAPCQMFLRVAVGLNVWQDRKEEELVEFEKYAQWRPSFKRLKGMNDQERLEEIKKYYRFLVDRKISLPGPILMHAGSEKNQMASCFLEYCSDSLTGEEYSINGKVGGIMKALTQLAKQSQGGAGTAVAFHEIRSKGSFIASSNGKSNGILPFMKMFDATIGAVNQSGKRAGVCTIYLEPWHADILEFLDAANHFTIEEKRCKNLFFALWVNDLFFERLTQDKANAQWTLFDPVITKQYLGKPLSEFYGQEFKEKYLYLESLAKEDPKIGKTISLMEIWKRVCHLFQTVGVPYIVNKDQMNLKSNQKNLGTIKSSNVCTEIALVSNEQETAVCVLSSLCISRFLKKDQDWQKGLQDENLNEYEKQIDFEAIIQAASLATRQLNNVIDLQFYPTLETRNSCWRRRAIGIGLQGLADLFFELDLSFTSPEAKAINKKIYECIYYGCLLESMHLAKEEGPYDGFEGSPASMGILQYDMWGLTEKELFLGSRWLDLKQAIQKYGLRNSEVTAQMPTASSAIRMDQNEMCEPITRNIYIRQTVAGSLESVNRYLVEDLIKQGIWNEDLCNKIIYNDGSVVGITEINRKLQEKYRTVYEIDWRDLIDMMADRAPFISQTHSFNHYTSFQEANPTTFTQKIIYAWKKGLKTLSYYMHTEAATTAKKELGISKNLNETIFEKNCNNSKDCDFCQA